MVLVSAISWRYHPGGVVKPQKPSLTFKSFQDLKALLETKSFSFPEQPFPDFGDYEEEATPEVEEELFAKAMEEVTPIERQSSYERTCHIRLAEGSQNKEDAEAVSKLEDLVKYGAGFEVANTPEYVEGTGYNVPAEFAKRLHRGDYAIQAHVDLHGLSVNDAKEALEKFLKWAVLRGKRGILIVHGRGLSSPTEGVLKEKVIEWLTRGPWRKWIIAYASARICDGGAGATYVLLRTRPLSKRYRRSSSLKRMGRGGPF